MKARIAGLALVLMGITMIMITKVLFFPGNHIPIKLWEEYFPISIFLGAGLILGMSFCFLANTTIKPIVICSFAGSILGLATYLFVGMEPFSILKLMLVAGAVISFPFSAILFLIDGVGFMFFKTYLVKP